MLYRLLYRFHTEVSVLNVTRYITFRTAAASLSALAISLALGPWLIRKLREFQIGQVIRLEGPSSHKPKAGTPTMGGLLILTAALVPTLLWADLTNIDVWIAVVTTALFGGVGFLDDYLKIVRRDHHGLMPRYKLGLQVLIGAGVGLVLLALAQHGEYNTRLVVPFFKRVIPELGWLYLPFAIFVLTAESNAVNLTDGLDGLAISVFAIAAAAYTALAYVVGNRVLADYLLLTHFSQAGELTVFCGSLVGASLGFLWYNSYPAEIFMGDVGSLALGAALGHGRDSHQAGTAARDRRRRVRARSALGGDPGRLVQADRAARVQDGADPSPLRADRMERAESDHAVRDRRGDLCVVQFNDPQTAVTVGTGRWAMGGGRGERTGCRSLLKVNA